MTTPENRPSGDTDDTAARPGSTAPDPRHREPDPTVTSLAALDEPIDRRGIGELLDRPGLARSTRRLLVALGVVLLLAVGAFVGRVTAPAPRGAQDPPLVGAIESVDPVRGGTVLTLRGADGNLTAVRTTPGTRLATVRVGDPTTLGLGIAVEVGAVQADDGSLTATRIDVVPG